MEQAVLTRAAPLFRYLARSGALEAETIHMTDDGLWLAGTPVGTILESKGIFEVPGARGQALPCRYFFDDWYLYALQTARGWVYSLVKFREQEQDARLGRHADGDIPGVTVCFISFREEVLKACLEHKDDGTRGALAEELDRVVARRGQPYDHGLRDYFADPRSQGAYLMAGLYVRHIAAQAVEGKLPLPEHWDQIAGRTRRLRACVDGINRAAGQLLVENGFISVQDPAAPTPFEARAILATHTGNPDLHSFAAEVRLHALFLVNLPLLYESAVRADLSANARPLQFLAPYYRPGSRLLRIQRRSHPEYE